MIAMFIFTFDRFCIEFERFQIGQVLKTLERTIVEEELRTNQMNTVQIVIIHEGRGIDLSRFVSFDDHRTNRIVRELFARDNLRHFREFTRFDLAVEIETQRGVTSRRTT